MSIPSPVGLVGVNVDSIIKSMLEKRNLQILGVRIFKNIALCAKFGA